MRPATSSTPLRSTGLLGAVLLLAATARADAFVLDSQSRSVEIEILHTEATYESCIPISDPLCQPTSYQATPYQSSASAPDAGPWTASAELAAFPDTSAQQDSEIDPNLLHAAGSHQGTSHYALIGSFPLTVVREDHSGSTTFSATFTLATAHPFTLAGSLAAGGGLFSGASTVVRLSGAGGVVAEVVAESDPDCADPECHAVGPLPVDARGTLAPGSYTFEAIASGTAGGYVSGAGAFGSAYDGAFDVTLDLSPPAVPALPLAPALALAGGLVAAARRALPRGRSRPPGAIGARARR